MKFLILFVFVGLFFGVIVSTEVFGQVDTKAFDNICTGLDSVELVHSINDGKVLEMCAENISTPTVFMIVQANNDSQLTVEVPKEMVYAVNQNCSPAGVTIIINDGFGLAAMDVTAFSRIFTIDIPKGFYNEVEIIGTYTLGDDVHQYCGEIYGYDSQYLPPEIQLEKGRATENIRCNEGLELVITNNIPVCVTDEQTTELDFVESHEPGGDYIDEGLFFHDRALRDLAEAEQTTDPELQKSLYLTVEQDLRGAWLILGDEPEIIKELKLVREIIKEKYPDYPLLITTELTKVDEGIMTPLSTGEDDDLIIGNLVNRTSKNDGVYEATIYFQDYEEPNRIPGGVMTTIFEIRDGTIHGNNPNLRGIVAYDGGISLELQFAGGECYPWGNMEPTNKFSAESGCTYGDVRIEAQKIGELSTKKQRGGCLIATATYGSELAPQVQLLREIRDNSLLQTESGTSFMNAFNEVYYSFSPYIADYERENPVFREIVKVTITPMISSLSILNYVDMDSEESVLGYGILLILLNIGMYAGIPAVVIVGIRKLI